MPVRRSRKKGLPSLSILLLVLGAALAWAKLSHIGLLPETPAKADGKTPPRRHQDNEAKQTPTPTPPGPSGIDQSIHVTLGVPVDGDPSDDYLIDHGVYVLSYNSRKNVANWVSWTLDRAYLGHVRRKNDFRPDPALPNGFYPVTPADYHASGYDRGHLCPSADREASLDDNSLTFLMANIHPQLHELNAGPWEKLEEYERELARRRDARLFIVAGGVFGGPNKVIGHEVTVPKASYKVVVQLRQGQGPSDVKPSTKLIAVIMPNEPGVGAHPWTDYLTSVDVIEKATGYDFLSRVPKEVQGVIEAKVTSQD